MIFLPDFFLFRSFQPQPALVEPPRYKKSSSNKKNSPPATQSYTWDRTLTYYPLQNKRHYSITIILHLFAHLVNKNKIIFCNILFRSVYRVYNRHKFKVCPISSKPPYIYCLYYAMCVTIILYYIDNSR